MNLLVRVEWAEWQCVKDSEQGGDEPDHPHEDGFVAYISVPNQVVADDARLNDVIHDALINQCGLCITDGSWDVLAWNPTHEEVDSFV
jgi:hypothetical protein